jgi:pimeloyl-ACP methyl ester carboxylesterase
MIQQCCIILFIILIFIVFWCMNKSEKFTMKPNIVGGINLYKMVLNNYTTNIKKLLGNNGKTIILLHNTPFNMEIWSALFMKTQQLKSNGEQIPTLICYDLMGHGTGWVSVPQQYNDVSITNKAWDYNIFVEHLYEIFKEHSDTSSATIVGYGFGGLIGQAFTVKYPQLVEKLFVLGTTIRPTITEVPDEVRYLVNWIAANPNIPYLTMPESFVQHNLCLWFDNNDIKDCPLSLNARDKENRFNTIEYLFGKKILRQSYAATYLQVDKMLSTEDLRDDWTAKNINVPIVFLVGDRDHFTNIDTIKQDVLFIRNKVNSVKLYIVNGKHAFPLTETTFMYNLITGKDMSNDPLTLEVN